MGLTKTLSAASVGIGDGAVTFFSLLTCYEIPGRAVIVRPGTIEYNYPVPVLGAGYAAGTAARA